MHFILLCASAFALRIERGHSIYFTEDEPLYAEYQMMLNLKTLNYRTYHPYRDAERILFLADGFNRPTSLAPKVADKYPLPEVYQSDRSPPDTPCPAPRVHRCIIDNTKEFPFSEDFFDTIVMRAGLCCCTNYAHTCGGIANDASSKLSFIYKIITILKKIPTSIALLHGNYFHDFMYYDSVHDWHKVMHSIKKNPHIQIHMLFGPYAHTEINEALLQYIPPHFFGIEIKWK